MSQAPTTTTPTPVPMASTTTITAGTPVPTYPSPAHAQWAAGQIQIDPSLQQQQQQQSQQAHASTSATATPKPQLATTVAAQTPTAQTPITNYYNYQHYPYYQQYMAQAVAQAHSHQAASATPLRTGHTSTPTATATSTPVISSYTPAATAPGTAAVPGAAANPASLDSSDIATLNDALGSAGVDLRAEEESLQRHESHITHVQSYTASYLQNRAYEDRGKRQPLKPAFDTRALGTTMRSIGSQNKVTKIPEDSVNYVALAVRARLQDLITAMIKASRYRKEAQFDRPASFYESPNSGGNAMDVDGVRLESQTPMWSIVVRSDVAKQLSVLERIEREEEMRMRKERMEMAATLAAQAAGGGGAMDASLLNATTLAGNGRADEELDGQPKKKKKKEGPGVTARNMSEDVRKKMSNAVATQAAGLGKYAWMTAAANAPSPTPKAKANANANAGASGSAAQSAWARPYVPKKPVQPAPETPVSTKTEGDDPNKIVVTMRDAMFVVEKERGHGGGKGSARGWT